MKFNNEIKGELNIKYIQNKLKLNIPFELLQYLDTEDKDILQSYYNRLKLVHVDLSKNEKILSGFIRLGFSSKQICQVLNRQVNSVEVARTRLRKKIGITNSKISLIQYLESI